MNVALCLEWLRTAGSRISRSALSPFYACCLDLPPISGMLVGVYGAALFRALQKAKGATF
jgi:hypothetical protein